MRTPIEPFLPTLARRFLAREDLDLLLPLRLMDGGDESPRRSSRVASIDRSHLAAALLERNRAWGHVDPEPLCRKLADPATRIVITGQQAGLLGGPLYALTKAVAATLWAERLEERGEPALALFWVATEDHDFAEVAKCTLPGPGQEALTLALEPPKQELRPVGDLTIGSAVVDLLAQVRAELSALQQAHFDRLARGIGPDSLFGDAFGAALTTMLGAHCPLLLDAQEPELKKLERPWLRRLIEDRVAVDRALAEREQLMLDRDLPLQVAPQPDWSPLFLVDERGQRRRIGWRGDERFELRGEEPAGGSIGQLLELLDREPGRLSPGALARPAIQDAVLGTSVFVVGPGELSYMAQASAIYPVLDLEATNLALRPQCLIVDRRRSEQLAELAKLGLDLAVVLGDESELEATLARLAGGEPVTPARAEILERFDRLEAPLLAIEPQLGSAFSKTRAQIEKALDILTSKATQSVARSDQVTRNRVESLRQVCCPGGRLQERIATAGPLFCLYGNALADALARDLDLDPRFLQVITPGEMGPGSSKPEHEEEAPS